jgi:hypothetical protein
MPLVASYSKEGGRRLLNLPDDPTCAEVQRRE